MLLTCVPSRKRGERLTANEARPWAKLELRANPAAKTFAGDGVLRDFVVRFQQGQFKDRKADKDTFYPTLITASHKQQNVFTRGPIRSDPICRRRGTGL
jgi:hypothetical protein